MKNLIYLLPLLILTSCASKIDYHMPVTRFDTPEVSGEFLSGSIEWNMATSKKVTLGSIWTDAFIVVTSSTDDSKYLETSKNFTNFTFELGLLPTVDFYTDTHWDSPAISGIKIQIFGTSKKESTEGIKLALKAGFGATELEQTSTYTGWDGTSSSIKSIMDLKSYEAALIFGYRKSKELIGYLTGYYHHFKVEADLLKDNTTEISASGISRNYGLLAGVRIGHKSHASFEGGVVKSSYESISTTSGVVGLEFGYSW